MTETDATNESKLHVLLVDDDVEIVESMRYALEANERDDRKILRVRAKHAICIGLSN